MKCRKLIKQVTCLAFIVSLISATTLTAFAAMIYGQYEVEAIIAGSGETIQLAVLNVEGSAYISVEAAAELSGMEYAENNSGDYIFSRGRHQVTYDGQTKEVDGVTYLRMQNAMDQLSCQYAYSPSLEAIVFEPTEDFIEDLQFDCNVAFDRFDLSWVEEVPFAKETVRLYGFFTDGWNLKYLWGGDRREQYENTLWGIMVPTKNESTLLSIADDGNKVVKKIYNIVEDSDEAFSLDLTEIGLLIPVDFMNTYKTLNNFVPGMSVSDYLELLDKAYGSQYASTLYANSVKYGLYNNSYIEDIQLDAALKNTEKYFDGDTLLLQSFMEDWAANYLEKGIEDLSEAALEESFSYNNSAVKMFSLLTDEFLGMKKNTGAVLALLDCAEIQQEAFKQYEKSLKHLNSTDAILTMKYSTILYLRACEYGYETYKSTGDVGQDCYEIMQPLTSAMIKRIASYSDDELTREIRNKNLNFSLKGFSLINNEMQEKEVQQFRFSLNASNGYEDYISFSPSKSGWYTFTANGTGYFWMEAPNREMTEYRLEGHVFSEYGLHYYLSGEQQYYIKVCSNSEANGKLHVTESHFQSLSENGSLQLPLADCYGGFDGGGIAANYFSFTPTSTGTYYINCGPKELFVRSGTFGIARDAYGNSVQVADITDSDSGAKIMEYHLNAGNTYFFGLSASPGGICDITVCNSPYDSDDKTDTDRRNYKIMESDISGMITEISGKLNIRSGPGTSYEVVGYLLPNDIVEVYETAYNEDITWGHIEQGWISMDYVGSIIHRNSANTIYAEDYVDFTTAEILAELGPEYDLPGAYAGSYLLRTINYPDFYFAYNLNEPTSDPYITGFEPVVCIYLFGDASINEYLSANMSKAEIDRAIDNPDVLSSSTDTVYVALDNTGNVFQYQIETRKAYIRYEWYMDSGSSTNYPADSICVSPK